MQQKNIYFTKTLDCPEDDSCIAGGTGSERHFVLADILQPFKLGLIKPRVPLSQCLCGAVL